MSRTVDCARLPQAAGDRGEVSSGGGQLEKTHSEGGAWEMTDNDTWYLAIRCELRAISWAIAEVRDLLHGGRPLRTEDESERS